MSGYKKKVRNLAVSVYHLIPSTDEQLELFASPTHTGLNPTLILLANSETLKCRLAYRLFEGTQALKQPL
jgi:hypothetical protein